MFTFDGSICRRVLMSSNLTLITEQIENVSLLAVIYNHWRGLRNICMWLHFRIEKRLKTKRKDQITYQIIKTCTGKVYYSFLRNHFSSLQDVYRS